MVVRFHPGPLPPLLCWLQYCPMASIDQSPPRLMQKFRRLRLDELQEVETQFVRFLATNGLDASAWQKLKEQQPGKADQIILQFSQLVFAGVIGRVEYLLDRRPKDIRAYHCLPDKIILRGLLIEGETTLDLSLIALSAQDMIQQIKQDGAQVKIFQAERPYRNQDREQDLFLLMEAGALIADETMFQLLEGGKGEKV